MANATKLPDSTELVVFKWETPSAPNPRLNGGVSSSTSDTTLRFSNPPLDEGGAVVTEAFLMGCTNNDGYTETIYVPAGALSADGLTATGVVRGIRPSGLDFTTGSSDFAAKLDGNSKVFCSVDATQWYLLQGAVQGTIATGSHTLILGDETAATTDVKRSTSAGTSSGFVRHTGTKAQYSDNGTDYVNFSDSSSSTLVAVSADDTTPGYLFAKMAAGDGIDLTETTPGGDEDVTITVDITDFIDTAAGLQDDGSNNIQINEGNGLEFNAGALQVKAGSGITVDASGVSTSNLRTLSGVAYETLTDGAPIAEIPVETQWYQQMDDSNFIDLGDDNARRRFAIKRTATETKTISGDRFLRLKSPTGSSTLTITYGIQADSSGDPSGTYLDSNTLASSGLGTSATTETFNLATGASITKGQDYWEVVEVDGTDATDYVQVQVASGFDEYFVTAERKTFDLDAGTWGGSVSNAPFWCWGDENFGMALVEADRSIVSKCWSFVGFAAAAYSAGDDAQYYHDLTDTAAGVTLAKGQDVFLGSSGQVTLSPSSFSVYTTSTTLSNSTRGWNYRIGKTVEADDGTILLKIDKGSKRMFISGAVSGSTSIELLTFLNPATIRLIGQDTTGIAPFDVSFGVFAGGDQASVTDQVTSGENEIYNDGTRTATIANVGDAGFTLDNSTASAIGLILEINEI